MDIDKDKVDIICDHHSFIRSNNGSTDFKTTFEHHNVMFHHKCTGKYSKQKVDRLKKQQKKNKECAVSIRSFSSSKSMGSPFYAICDKEDNGSNLWAAGIQGATMDAVDAQHNAKLMERWKDTAIKTNNGLLLAKLATDSLASNKLFYHLDCYSSMNRNYQRIIEGKHKHQIEEHWIKATTFESIITLSRNKMPEGLIFCSTRT